MEGNPVGPRPEDQPTSSHAEQNVVTDYSYEPVDMEPPLLEREVDALQLELAVKKGIQHLDVLEKAITLHPQDTLAALECQPWMETIAQLRRDAEPTRVLIGVVGHTGAGKSSLVNAILGEERLVPTSGMRACTATVTEISWNYSDDPDQRYRAEIEFLSRQEWITDLEALRQDVIQDGQISRDCNNPDTVPGIAYSKIKAVYPAMSKEQILQGTPSAMAEEPLVRQVLGSVIRLGEPTASAMYDGMQKYVDSKERIAERRGDMEYSPLVKIVRIFCKAPVLDTGAVLVDLPGVQDSNAARAAVAESYIKTCNVVWITAAIQRAVDDKTAQKLLNDNFKRQMGLDGSYSNISFVCTKTDDILECETINSPRDQKRYEEAWSKIRQINGEEETVKHYLGEKGAQLKAVEALEQRLNEKYALWLDCSQKINAGHKADRPKDNVTKRKRAVTDEGRRLTHHTAASGVDASNASNDSNDDLDSGSDTEVGVEEDVGSGEGPSCPRLTQGIVDREITTIKSQLEGRRVAAESIRKEIKALENFSKDLELRKTSYRASIRSCCIKARNDYAKEVIKNDFVAGLKEFDQEAAEEENEDEFDPDQDLRDYSEVAQDLPVFCVSSRVFQALMGNLQQEAIQKDGFFTPEDTEIPQLQNHVKRGTEAVRANKARYFLNQVEGFSNSVKLYATARQVVRLSSEASAENDRFLLEQLNLLKKTFKDSMEMCAEHFTQELRDHIYGNFASVIGAGSRDAVDTAVGWGVRRDENGLRLGYTTYRATVRRFGEFTGAAGLRDFNAELLHPAMKLLDPHWHRVFVLRLPFFLRGFMVNARAALERFQRYTINDVPHRDACSVMFGVLERQVQLQITSLGEAYDAQHAAMTEVQRNANRMFKPAIKAVMQEAYTASLAEGRTGPGVFIRMRNSMKSHVETLRCKMFEVATDSVREELESIIPTLRVGLTALTDKVVAPLERDFKAAMVSQEETAAVREFRSQLRTTLSESPISFGELSRL